MVGLGMFTRAGEGASPGNVPVAGYGLELGCNHAKHAAREVRLHCQIRLRFELKTRAMTLKHQCKQDRELIV